MVEIRMGNREMSGHCINKGTIREMESGGRGWVELSLSFSLATSSIGNLLYGFDLCYVIVRAG